MKPPILDEGQDMYGMAPKPDNDVGESSHFPPSMPLPPRPPHLPIGPPYPPPPLRGSPMEEVYDIHLEPLYSPKSPTRPISPTTISLPLPFAVKEIEKSANGGTLFYDSPALMKNSWFHGKISRTEAINLLQGKANGTFLVRESESFPGQYAVSLYCDGCCHYRIFTNSNKTEYFISKSNDKRFDSLSKLINHHSKSSDGLKIPLQYPLPRTARRPIEPGSSNRVTSEMDEWELSRSEFQMNDKVGGGKYGDVYKALMKDSGETVAVKVFKVSVKRL